jgi:hypothetical protein
VLAMVPALSTEVERLVAAATLSQVPYTGAEPNASGSVYLLSAGGLEAAAPAALGWVAEARRGR